MEQKEKNNAVKEFLKRFLESAKCSPEMIAYLNEVDEAVFCEYYVFAFWMECLLKKCVRLTVFLLKIGKIRLEG